MSDANLIQFTLDHNAKLSLVEQIYQELRERISKGSLKPGSKLPSSRKFSKELSVSRSTIVHAYDQLIAEGYLESRPGSGVLVSNLPELKLQTSKRTIDISQEDRCEDKDTLIPPFYPGLPDMRLFPYEKWSKCVAKAARQFPLELISVQSRFGDSLLRKEISRHLLEWRGIATKPDNIIITAGAIGGLELVTQVLEDQTNTVALENPGYKTFRNSVLSRGIKPYWMQLDDQGAQVPSYDKSRIIVLTPSHQFPLGGTMPTARRTEFLNHASQTNSWILEDDFDSEFRYWGKPVKALAGMDEEGRVFYAGSFSKIFSTGLRLGYLVVPDQMVNLFYNALPQYSKAASVSPQRALGVFMESGEFHKHIRSMRRIYGARRKLFMKHLAELEGYLHYEDYQAGMQIALEFPDNQNDIEISDRLKDHNLICTPLSEFYVNTKKSGLLLGYCSFTEEEINENMKSFKQEIKKSLSFGARQAQVKG